MSVAVAKDGKTVFTRGYGLADVEMGVAASPETAYQIASVTKQFTAAAIMRLVEAGKVSLDDPITRFLPDYPVQGHHVTVRHLLNHTSGIKSYTELGKEAQRQLRLEPSSEEMVALFGKQPFVFKPGEKFRYNNSGYYLLARVIEEVTGAPYEEYMERELLQPLELHNTLYGSAQRIIPNRAKGYKYESNAAGTLYNAPGFSIKGNGAGGLSSTVGDLIRWTHLLHSGQVVSRESLRQMTTPTELSAGGTRTYGFGLDLARLGDHEKVVHTGDTDGFNSYLTHYPKEGLTIAVLTNSDDALHQKVEEALARTALGMELTTVLDLPLTAADIARYEGTYVLETGAKPMELRVFGEDGKLKVQLGGRKAFRFRSQGDSSFIPFFDEDIRLVFITENDRTDSVQLHMGGQVTPGKRKQGL